jgi:hypothetical protein
MIVIFDNLLILGNIYKEIYDKTTKVINRCHLRNVKLMMSKYWLGVKKVTDIASDNRVATIPRRSQCLRIRKVSSNWLVWHYTSRLTFRSPPRSSASLTKTFHGSRSFLAPHIRRSRANTPPTSLPWLGMFHVSGSFLAPHIRRSRANAPPTSLPWLGMSTTQVNLFSCKETPLPINFPSSSYLLLARTR